MCGGGGGVGGYFPAIVCSHSPFQIQESLFVALLLKRGLVFFRIFVKEIGKTTNFPSLDYEEYSSPPQGRVQNFALEERGGGGYKMVKKRIENLFKCIALRFNVSDKNFGGRGALDIT